MAKVEGKVLNTRDKVTVVGIKHKEGGKQKLVEGKTYSIHPDQAQNLIDTGHAISEADAKKATSKEAKK